MFTIFGAKYQHCDGLTRRAFLEAGALGIGGLTLADLLRAEAGRDALSQGLSREGALVNDVAVYRTVLPEESRETVQNLVAEDGIDVVAFTSSSTVSNLVALLGGDATPLKGKTLACIGPITAETARDAGLTVDVVAKEVAEQYSSLLVMEKTILMN